MAGSRAVSRVESVAGSERITRRSALKGAGVGALAVVTAPSMLRAQPSEIVIGGAASHKPWVESIVQPFFEKK
jgi:putative spermidine/putrescine transport system substrate-binding protein